MKLIFKILKIFCIVYSVLFAVFYFDLDGKLLYYVYEPLMCKHYDNIEGRRVITDMPYDMKDEL